MRLPTQDSLIQDSLTDEDFNFGEKVTVNKNNYTLTYSGQGVIGSFIASMVSSAGITLEPQGKNPIHNLLVVKNQPVLPTLLDSRYLSQFYFDLATKCTT